MTPHRNRDGPRWQCHDLSGRAGASRQSWSDWRRVRGRVRIRNDFTPQQQL